MVLRRLIGSCCLVSMLSIVSFGASSDIADAVMSKNKDAVRSLLQQKADVNATQADGATALHWAVLQDDAETVDLLIRAGANAKAANRDGATPLSLASTNGNAAIIEKLLQAGVDPNTSLSQYGDTALMMSARTGNPEAIKVLLAHGANVNAKETWGGTTALMWAVSEEHPEAAQLLIAAKADVNARTKIVKEPTKRGDGNYLGFAPRDPEPGEKPARGATGGMTPLTFAARQGDLKTAKLLLAAGANVNALMAEGDNAMEVAIRNGYYELATLFMDAGTDINHKDANDLTPLFLAVTVRNQDIYPGVPWIPTEDPLSLIQKLLDAGADVNQRVISPPPFRTSAAAGSRPWLKYEGATPFMRAAVSGDLYMMKLLMKYGADPNIPTKDGTTALAALAGVGWLGGRSTEHSRPESMQAMRMLIDLGVDVNQRNEAGLTALHGAALKGYGEAVDILVQNGGDLAIKDNGVTGDSTEPLMPLDFALGIRFVGSSVVPMPETLAVIQKYMKDQNIEHTTSECTLRGFTCGTINPKKDFKAPAPAAKP